MPAAVVAFAALSLLAPFALVYDPWAWLIWGRELVSFDLDTGAGPSWKPLPVLAAALFSPAGDAAPELWMLVARAGWLASLALAWRLAARLALPRGPRMRIGRLLAPRTLARARIAAGAVAALGIMLLFDPFTPWVRQFAGGVSEPLLVALVLAAIDRELSHARGQALALGAGAALVRPEAWPFLALYGVFVWTREPRLRGWLIATAIAVPALWLVPDLVGSGDPLTGARRAREGTGAPVHELVEALGRSLNLVLAGLWVAAGAAVVGAWRDRERPILLLAAGAMAWIAIVAVLAAAGYAGLPRFAAPAGAVVCVLAGVGVVRLAIAVNRAPRGTRRTALAAACAVLVLGIASQAAVRGAEIPGQLDAALDFGHGVDDLFAVVDRAGEARIRDCGPVTTTDFLTETALAWRLEVGLDRVASRDEGAAASGTELLNASAPPPTRRAVLAAGRPIAGRGAWSAYAISCAARPSASGARASSPGGLASAGVAGARR